MFRRPTGGRNNRRLVSQASGAGVPIVTLLDYVDSAKVLAFHRADLGISLGTGVAGWADQSGAGRDYAQGTGSLQPTYSASGGPNGTACVRGDGVSQYLLDAAFDLPAPFTTPTYVYLVARLNTWAANRTLFGSPNAFNAANSVICSGTTPNVAQFNGATGNTVAMTLGTWKRMIARFDATANTLLQFGSVSQSALNHSTTDPGAGRSLFARANGSNPMHADVAEILYLNAAPSAGELAAMDAHIVSRYGASMVT